MAEEVYQQTLAALAASLDSRTSSQNRSQANEFISQLKGTEQCSTILIYILTTEDAVRHTEYIRLLALTILNDWIVGWWNQLDQQVHEMLKTAVVSLLLNPSVGASPSKPLRTKLGEKDRKIDRKIERQTDRKTDKQTERQTDRQTNRQTDRQTHICFARERVRERGDGVSRRRR